MILYNNRTGYNGIPFSIDKVSVGRYSYSTLNMMRFGKMTVIYELIISVRLHRE